MNGNSFPLLRNTRFVRLWIGQIASQSSIRMYQIALLWWMLSQFASHAGKVSACFLILCALPSILFVRRIGKTVDTVSRKKILVTADILAATLVLSIAILSGAGWLRLPFIYFSAFFLSLCQAFYDPTLFKALPELVEQKDLETGVAFLSSTQSIANFSGAILGAVLIEALGLTGVAVLNTIGYSVALLCNLSIRFGTEKENVSASSFQSAQNAAPLVSDSALTSFRPVLYGFAAINFFSMPTLVLLPLFVRLALNGSATTLSALEASLWLGLIAGTFLAKRIGSKQDPLRLGALALLGMGFSLGFPGLWVHFFICLLCLFFSGFCLGLNNTRFLSFFQLTVPPSLKGRFFALLQALTSFTAPLAYFVFGASADFFGPRSLVLIQGLGVILISFYFFRLSLEPLARLGEESP